MKFRYKDSYYPAAAAFGILASFYAAQAAFAAPSGNGGQTEGTASATIDNWAICTDDACIANDNTVIAEPFKIVNADGSVESFY